MRSKQDRKKTESNLHDQNENWSDEREQQDFDHNLENVVVFEDLVFVGPILEQVVKNAGISQDECGESEYEKQDRHQFY